MNCEVEQIVGKRNYRGKIQYRIKWLNFDRRHNRWTNEDDLDCDLLTARFEDCHEIVGYKKKASRITYNVHMSGKHVELIDSNDAKQKWPKQLFDYLQKSIKMVNDEDGNSSRNSNRIDLSKVKYADDLDDSIGHPIKVCYVTDAGNEWHYLFKWSDGSYRFIKSANLKRWYRLVIEYLETLAVKV